MGWELAIPAELPSGFYGAPRGVGISSQGEVLAQITADNEVIILADIATLKSSETEAIPELRPIARLLREIAELRAKQSSKKSES